MRLVVPIGLFIGMTHKFGGLTKSDASLWTVSLIVTEEDPLLVPSSLLSLIVKDQKRNDISGKVF